MTPQTQPAQPEALALAERLEDCAIKYGEGTSLGLEAYSASKLLRRLHAENEQLQAERDEADRRAGRAERFMASLQDDLRGARFDLAQLRESKPLSDERMHELMQEHAFCIGPMTYAFGRSVEAAHGIGEKTP